jgi:CRP-like cAMP-binding protein
MTKTLKQQVLFHDMDSVEINKMAKIAKKMTFKKGEHLFTEKDDTKGLYLIHSGKVEISKITSDGWRQTIAALTPGHFFGELSILEKRKHEASAVAVEDTELFIIVKEDFEKLMEEDIELACKIITKIAIVMSKNLRRMNDKFLSALISY